MGKPVNDGLVDETSAPVDEPEFSFQHTPPLYGSICFVFTGAIIAFVLSCIGDYLSYPSLKDATFVAYESDFFAAMPPHATVEVLASGFAHLLGLVWVPDSVGSSHIEDSTTSPAWQLWRKAHKQRPGSILFSDSGSNAIYKWRDGTVSIFARPAGYTGPFSRKTLEHTVTGPLLGPAGLTIDAERHVVVCQHGDRRVALMTDIASFMTVVDSDSDGESLNSPHRVVARASGDLYFTDPPLGLAYGKDSVFFNGYAGLHWYSHVTGQTQLLTKALGMPTGLALRKDERTLFVADNDWNGTNVAKILAFSLRSDGSLVPSKPPLVFYESAAKTDQFAGLAVDAQNRLYAAHGSGITILSPEGKLLGRIELAHAEAAQDLAWDDTFSTLYVITTTRLLRILPDTHRILT